MQDFQSLCQLRRSYRKYTDQPVEQEKLDYIIRCALMSPAGKRMNPWHFVVITTMMAADTTPALHWLWLIISGPFSFVGRKLPVSGCLTVHCCSLNSAHASGNSILAKSLHLTISAACQALEDSTAPLHRPPSLLKGGLVLWLLLFPVFVTETW